MKELFSKILNIVTLSAVLVWLFVNCVVFFLAPDHIDFILDMDEKFIWGIFGALIGAGGSKLKTTIEAAGTSSVVNNGTVDSTKESVDI